MKKNIIDRVVKNSKTLEYLLEELDYYFGLGSAGVIYEPYYKYYEYADYYAEKIVEDIIRSLK